jgi:putative membrane protein insertion efficiency factor
MKLKKISEKFLRKFIILLIDLYKFSISPILGNNCRFSPTCSEFMKQAIEKNGIKGIWIGIKRILKCHPFNKGGDDPLVKWTK